MGFQQQRRLLVFAPDVPEFLNDEGDFFFPCEILHYQNPEIVRQVLLEKRPDMAFIAYKMRGCPSFDLYQIIQLMFDSYQIPVVCIGDVPRDQVISDVLALGAVGYLQLPLSREMLHGCLASWMNMADRLRQIHQKLKEKDNFLMMVTHDLNNPLGRSTFAGGILADNPIVKRDAYSNQLVQQVVSANKEMAGLLEMLLSLSEVEAESTLNRRVVDLGELLSSVAQGYLYLANSKNIQLEIKSSPGSLLVEIDPVWLEHAVGNLLSNAIKFTPKGGQVCVRLWACEIGLVIKVSDSGLGIPPEDLPYIFNKFYKTGRRDLKAVEGSGLGLAIVRTAVSRYHGQVLVESAYGEGTTFFIVLPPRLLCQTPEFSLSFSN